MGRVESEQTSNHYPPNPLRRCLGFMFRYPGQISRFLEMRVFKFLSDLDFWLICFTSSSRSALFRIQGMFRDARRQVPQGSMGSSGDLERLYAPLLFRLYPSANCKAVVLVLMLIPGVRTCNYSWFWPLVDRISYFWYQSDPGYAVAYSKLCIAMVRP